MSIIPPKKKAGRIGEQEGSSQDPEHENEHRQLAQGLLSPCEEHALFHLRSGYAANTPPPAAVTHADPAIQNPSEAVQPFGLWEDHAGGIFQVWAAEKLLQETPAQTLLHQPYPVPALAAGVQAGR